MKGLLWNIRGLNQPGRKLSLEHSIRDNRLDFIGIQETKKESFTFVFLKNLACPTMCSWEFLPANGTARGILLGVRDESFIMSGVSVLKSFVSCMLQDKKSNFC
jgi:hypothetical protein